VDAGNGIEKNNICSLISKLKLDAHVYLPGFITKDEKNNYLIRVDYYILPSVISKEGDREGLPVSLLESMAFGNICIATWASGAGEIIQHGKNGFLCDSGDVSSLYQAMESLFLLDNKDSNRVKAAAKLTAEKYNWDLIIERQINHFFKEIK